MEETREEIGRERNETKGGNGVTVTNRLKFQGGWRRGGYTLE